MFCKKNLTMPLSRSLPGASTSLDYSADMMENARKRAEEMKLDNVSFLQGGVRPQSTLYGVHVRLHRGDPDIIAFA